MKKYLESRLAIAFALTFFVSFLSAEDVTSGSLTGNVLNQSGDAVSGASLVVKSTSTGVTRSATSGADGSVRVPLLAVGSYTVSVSASGYTTLSDTVNVSLGGASSYNFVLSSASADVEDVVVVGSVVESYDFDRTTTGISIDVDEVLGRTPVNRNITSLVLLAPGTTEGDSAFGNLASVSGSSVAENVYLVNGLNITNFRNFTGASTVPFEFYEQVDVKTGGYQAEFGKAIGGVVNAVTRSGTNDFTASVSVYETPDALRSQSPNTYAADNNRRESDQREINISVGGPIIEDKLFYYVLFNPDESEVSSYGLLSGRTTTSQLDDEFLGYKLDYYLTSNTHFEYTFFSDETQIVYNEWEYDVDTGVKGAYIGESYDNIGGDNEIFKVTSVINDNLTVSFMQGSNDYNRTSSGSGDQYPAIYDARSGSFVPVGQQTSFTIDVGSDSRDMTRFDVDYYVGKHHFRMGYEEEELTAINATINSGGVYYAWFDGDAASGIASGEGNDVVRVRNYSSGGTFVTEQEAFYIQDSWDVTDRLNLNIGLRRSSFNNKNAEGNTFVKAEDQDALRIGATYDLSGDGSSKLFASFGEYYLPIAANTNIRMAGGETYIQTWYNYPAGAPADFLPVGIPVEKDENNPAYLRHVVYGDGSVPDTRSTTDNSLEPMYGEELILGYQTTLEKGMFAGWDFEALYVERELASTIEDVAIDAAVNAYCEANNIVVSPAVAATDTTDAVDAVTCADEWTGFHQYVLTNPGTDMNVYLPELDATVDLSAADLGYPSVVREYTGLTFTLSRAFDNDWTASLSYTNSESIGNYEGTVKSDNGQDDAGITQDFDQPGLTDGSYGLLPNHREHLFKGSFSKVLRDDLLLGINSTITSPRVYGCIGVHPTDDFAAAYAASSWYCQDELTPRGSVSQSNWVINMDLLLSWNVSDNLNVRMDVFNLFNFDSVDDIREYGDQGTGAIDPNYLKPTSYQTPRKVRLGFKYSF
jgi:hypothetical protein